VTDGVLDSILADRDRLRSELDAINTIGDFGDLRVMQADLAETRACLRECVEVLEFFKADEKPTFRFTMEWARRLLG
jgi:adenylate cyclase class IV